MLLCYNFFRKIQKGDYEISNFITKYMNKNYKKLLIVFSIAITIFSIGIVYKTFQNDTFFNIAIGKHILENGIDMKEHFCWIDDDLYYTHSHWIFDIVIYLIYNSFGFAGIYVTTVLFTIFTSVTLFLFLCKRNRSPIISFFITLISMYVVKSCFTARSQIISFVCFIIEIFCLEQFIETNKKRYALTLIIISIIVANFHAATWPLLLVLCMPYIAASFLNILSSKNIYGICIKRLKRKIEKLPKDSEKIAIYEQDIKDYERIINERKSEYADYKVVRREHYNTKNLVILMIIIALTGLLTPTHGTPYTYIVKSMFGESNFENNLSIDYINEMQPITPITNIAFIVFTVILLSFLVFLPTKIKTEHGFLIAGLYIMALSSGRYVYLLVLLGSFVINDLMTQATNLLIKDDIEALEKFFSNTICAIITIIFIAIFSTSMFLDYQQSDYVDEKEYPVAAVEYIKENLDYKNIRIFNSYNNGSYLMLNDIPVFIDSRLDVYCSEFNNTDIFYDFIQISTGNKNYNEIFEKYNFTHVLLKPDDKAQQYICKDSNYNIIFEDDNYILYEKVN